MKPENAPISVPTESRPTEKALTKEQFFLEWKKGKRADSRTIFTWADMLDFAEAYAASSSLLPVKDLQTLAKLITRMGYISECNERQMVDLMEKALEDERREPVPASSSLLPVGRQFTVEETLRWLRKLEKLTTDGARLVHIRHLLEKSASLPVGESMRPKIVCLCGSTRFYEHFQRANYDETMLGNIVLSVGFYPHAQKEMHHEEAGCTPEQKIGLDELHKRKIDLADEVFVLNVGGYIGSSTRSEIDYAEAHETPVRYLEKPQLSGDALILGRDPASASSETGSLSK